MTYQARLNDFATFITKDEQLDYFLNKGCNIYEINELGENLIATPKDGFLYKRPQIEKKETSNNKLSQLESDIDFLAMMNGIDLQAGDYL